MKIPTNLFKIKDSKYLELLPDFKKEKTQKISSIIFSLVALSFFGLFAINPTLSTIARLNKELKDSKYVDEQLKTKISNLYTLQQKYSLIQEEIPIVLSALPENPQVPNLIAQIQALGKTNNINLNGVQSNSILAAGNQEPAIGYFAFNFSTGGEGTYENIVAFLTDLTSMRRSLDINSISISKGTDSNSLQFTIQGTTYYKK